MSRRIITKTYVKSKKVDYSALAFDEIFNTATLGPVKAASLNTKWGSTSFTSTRTLILDKSNNLKRSMESAEDPFSFDCEVSPKKQKHKNFDNINGNILDKNRNISKNIYDEIPEDNYNCKTKKFFTVKRVHPFKVNNKMPSIEANIIENKVELSEEILSEDENEKIWNSIVTDKLNDSSYVPETQEPKNICFNIDKIKSIFQTKPSFEKSDTFMSPLDEKTVLNSCNIEENIEKEESLSQPDPKIESLDVNNSLHQPVLRKCATVCSYKESNNRTNNRRLLNHRQGHLKRRFNYKHFVWNDQDEAHNEKGNLISQNKLTDNCSEIKSTSGASFDFPDDCEPTCASIQNKLTMVVRNVRPAHETQESGETQEFKDDVKYIMDGFIKGQALSTRCLSAISLLNKCGLSSFRMYLRAHGVLDRVFSTLEDAYQYHSLALCCSAIFLLMSSDRLSLDIDLKICDLLLKLCHMPSLNKYDVEVKEFKVIQSKVNSLCNQSDLVKRGQLKRHALQLTTVSRLAYEALLKCAARKDIDFFRDELKSLKGLDLIVDAVDKSTLKIIKLSSCSYDASDEESSDEIDTDADDEESLFALIEQSLEVLENMTFLNHSNQEYLILYSSTSLTSSLNKLYHYCSKHLICIMDGTNEKSNINLSQNNILDLLLAVLRLLLNLTNEYDEGAAIVGQQNGLIEDVFYCLLKLPSSLPSHQRFNFVVLCLSLLVNLVENSRYNQQTLINYRNMHKDPIMDKEPLVLLAQIFSCHFSAAKNVEDEGELDRSQYQKKINIDNISNNSTLQKADKHMEDSIISAYVALLIGSILQNSSVLADDIRDHIPERNFENLYFSLQKFLNFMNMTSGVRPACAASMMKILDVLASF